MGNIDLKVDKPYGKLYTNRKICYKFSYLPRLEQKLDFKLLQFYGGSQKQEL